MAYVLKKDLANRNNYGSSRNIKDIKYIVIHYTGNDGDTDEGNGNYFNGTRGVSAHYFVDSDSVTISVPDNYIAWSVGGNKYPSCSTTGGGKYYGKCTNANSISIELCDDVRNGVVYPSAKTIENAIALTKSLMKKYNIPASNVIRHFCVTGKLCPAYWCGTDAKDAKWKTEFHNKLTAKQTTTKPSSTSKTSVTSSKNVIAAGTKLNLKKVDLYASSITSKKSSKKTGVYYVWSKDVVHNRIRITNSKANVGKSGQITGWINYTDAKNSVSTAATKTQSIQKSLEDWAKEVIAGKHGNGIVKRTASLKKAGCPYSYIKVQAKVNTLLKK
jgi:N-acetylmuramoyl-L-alanine amidase CwlA